MKNFFTLSTVVYSVIVTGLLFAVQKLGVLEPLEIRLFDQMMQMRADSGTDSRLLIVAITEDDIKKWKSPTSDRLSGQVLDNLLGKLEQYQPRAIGLDIYRDLPIEPGHNNLLKRLQQSDIIIPICKHRDNNEPGVSPPEGIEPSKVGFIDVVEDSDGTIRRNLLLFTPAANDACAAEYSLSLQLALKYLKAKNIQPQKTSNQELQLGETIFKRLESNSGGYQNIDTGGYQIILNYRSSQVAEKVTMTDVLEDKVNRDLVKNRIILIGSTAPSLKDIFNTPYSTGKSDTSGRMAGVEIHAQSVSQILRPVLDKQTLFWFLPEWGEVVWILVWSLAGGIIASRIQHPLYLAIVGGTGLVVLFAGNFFIFTQAGWIPVISPALGFVLATGSVLGYTVYQSKQEKEKIAQQVQQQEEAIIQLQAFINQRGNSSSLTTPPQIPSETHLLKRRYKIIEPLSHGGFSETYLAQDTQRPSHPQCVVKQLRPAHQEETFLRVARRLFNTEAEILEVLGQHDQIPQLLAYFEENQEFYLIQEFIKGNSLEKEITPNKKFAEADVVSLLKEVLLILVFVHGHNVIHRDIKPSNLIRRESDGRIILIDFGAVKQIQTHQQNSTVAIGTPSYMPPEQMNGQPRLNSDIYALGILAIQALTGRHPKAFQRDFNTLRVVISRQDGSLQNWHNLAEISDKFAAVLNRMVNQNCNLRYQSATEVLNSLEGL
ncbi:CHASE2 domain-containing serine/threonine-protein kinase [Brasilonema octagenarum]|uniref:non-specific serine/threonine protein kinase n=1 Tax=Brasilonema octagenarum UFV-OR1 TaxID=417115 RepID=A0ABX1M9Z8_9CYAN|nr:CHASE2 domain-containing serine/threonine-protein kinase [Brasilonema octagenarum]NMF63881.1 serine/threonine protein kinase [Brasilonema octagenarum UFV-OR1]